MQGQKNKGKKLSYGVRKNQMAERNLTAEASK